MSLFLVTTSKGIRIDERIRQPPCLSHNCQLSLSLQDFHIPWTVTEKYSANTLDELSHVLLQEVHTTAKPRKHKQKK